MGKIKSDNVFKPKMARDVVDKYKEVLLKGHIIKIDGGGHDFVDVIPREDIMGWALHENVGNGDYCHMSRHPDQFKKAIDELKAEGYVVTRKHCKYSGGGQYAAYVYYLEED